MTRVIAIANEKGGVGKTTTVLNLGAALAGMDRRVLLVDLDPQGSLSSILRRTPELAASGADALVAANPHDMRNAVVPVDVNLWLAPATAGLRSETPPGTQDGIGGLRYALQGYSTSTDYILLDTPPSLGWLTTAALLAADDLLIPIQCQYMAMRGVRGILSAVARVHQDGNPHLRLLGVLATMYRGDSPTSRQVLDEMQDVFGSRFIDAVINDEEAVAVAPASGHAVVNHQPWTQSAASFRWLAQEIADGRR